MNMGLMLDLYILLVKHKEPLEGKRLSYSKEGQTFEKKIPATVVIM